MSTLSCFMHYADKEMERIPKLQQEKRVVNLMTEDLLKYFLEQQYKMPEALKNDLIYCERALMERVQFYNQLCASKPDVKDNAFEREKKAAACKIMLSMVAQQIEEIEMEFKILLLHVDDSTVDFRKMLVARGFEIMPELKKLILRQELDEKMWQAPTTPLMPIAVKVRANKDTLWQQFNALLQGQRDWCVLEKHVCTTSSNNKETSINPKDRSVCQKNSPSSDVVVSSKTASCEVAIKSSPSSSEVAISSSPATSPSPPPVIEIIDITDSGEPTKPSNDCTVLTHPKTMQTPSQLDFLSYFKLCSQEQHAEMLKSRPKRKRRSLVKKINDDYVYDKIEHEPKRSKNMRGVS